MQESDKPSQPKSAYSLFRSVLQKIVQKFDTLCEKKKANLVLATTPWVHILPPLLHCDLWSFFYIKTIIPYTALTFFIPIQPYQK